MRKTVYCLGLTVFGIALAACGPSISKGTVIGRSYVPGHSQFYMQPIPHTSCFDTGKTDECTTSYTYIPSYRWISDDWQLELQDCSQNPCATGWIDVDQSTYSSHPEGSFYS